MPLFDFTLFYFIFGMAEKCTVLPLALGLLWIYLFNLQ